MPPTPVTLDRLCETLDRLELRYFIREEQKIIVLVWKDFVSTLDYSNKGYLLLHSNWHRIADISHRAWLCNFTTQHNSQSPASRLVLSVTDDGQVRTSFEHSILCRFGLTPKQLFNFLKYSFGMSNEVFTQLDQMIPDPLTLPREEP